MPTADLISIPGFADPVSSLTHLIGAAVALVAGVFLVRRGMHARESLRSTRHRLRIGSLVVFVTSAVLLLSMSGVYHLLPRTTPARDVLQRLDHAAIFLLIAGTATPIYAIMFHGRWRWGMLTLLWMLACVGVTLKSVYFSSVPQTAGAALYVVMGWIAAIGMILMARRYGLSFIMPLLLGGVIYTLGAAVEMINPRPLYQAVFRSHELFHLAVLAGLWYQWRFIHTIAVMEIDPSAPASLPEVVVAPVSARAGVRE